MIKEKYPAGSDNVGVELNAWLWPAGLGRRKWRAQAQLCFKLAVPAGYAEADCSRSASYFQKTWSVDMWGDYSIADAESLRSN
ncbi:hypothetical protein PH586_00780 [Pseudomonas sp. SA3-5]|uniref:Uncharacterized protein n=1 Tax=Pseudomonas aestuarii TaxID=3018340 RepID=A0ABT4X971_9PSED|nr:hypothetical protein [Pseudomonas aestuarii]MDA7084922.1 hypothetical protein [Pseudomonas aestuarii]